MMKISELIGRRNREVLSDELGFGASEASEEVKLDAILEPYAERLADILAGGNNFSNESETAAIDIGLTAWRLGGLSCMNRLHKMALGFSTNSEEGAGFGFVDYISYWWDGIGTWRIY